MATSKKLNDEQALPQGVKNWDSKPQQVDGPNGPDPGPLPVDAGAGEANSKRKPQQVDGPVGPEPPEPKGTQNWDSKPQQVDGPEGPEPTDGTELIEKATGRKPKSAGSAVVKENASSPSSLDGKDDPPKGHGSKDGDKSVKGHGSRDGEKK